MEYRVIDRSIAMATEATKGGTRYITIPKALAEAMDIGDKCEMRLVEAEDGEKKIILSKFVP